MLKIWQNLLAGGHLNLWYLIAVAGLVLAYAVGYNCIFMNEEGKRMRLLRPRTRALLIFAAGFGMAFCVLNESHAGIVHVLSGGKTAEQATKDGSAAMITFVAAIVVMLVYGFILWLCVCKGEDRKRKLLRKQRRARLAADGSAETTKPVAPRQTKTHAEPVALTAVGADKTEAVG